MPTVVASAPGACAFAAARRDASAASCACAAATNVFEFPAPMPTVVASAPGACAFAAARRAASASSLACAAAVATAFIRCTATSVFAPPTFVVPGTPIALLSCDTASAASVVRSATFPIIPSVDLSNPVVVVPNCICKSRLAVICLNSPWVVASTPRSILAMSSTTLTTVPLIDVAINFCAGNTLCSADLT